MTIAKRRLIEQLININEIDEEIKLISDSDRDYITPSGRVYVAYGNDKFFEKKTFVNKSNGYLYVNINTVRGKQKQRRVHILVALSYLPNPNKYPIVMHKDNNKSNPSVTNLKWGTVSENTKSAFDDGLLCNDKGFEDSQSIPTCVFDLKFNLIETFGSVSIASETMGITKSGILYQCKHLMKTKPRCGYYFRFLKEYEQCGFVL